MLIAKHGVNLQARYHSWSEALCTTLYMERSFMLIAIHGVKLYAHCCTWSEALYSLLYIERRFLAHCLTALCSLVYIE